MDLADHFNRQANKIAIFLIRQFDEQVLGIEGILKLTLGRPDLNTPGHVKEAIEEATDASFSHYTGISGLLDVHEAAACFTKEKCHLTYQPATETLVTVGAIEAISTSLLAILEQGDKVPSLTPIYPGYESIITLTGVESIYLDTRDGDFVLTPEMIEVAMAEHGKQVKAIISNYPSNPTGVTYNRQELQAIADILKKYDTFVINDEIYSELTYDESYVSIAEMPRDQTILINGSSKPHATTDWRIDFIFASTILTAEIIKVHQYLATAAATAPQKAAIRVLVGGMHDAEIMKEEYQKRCDFVYEQMIQLGFEVARPNGTSYIFAKIPTGREQDPIKLRINSAQERAAALIPGIPFGPEAEGYVRISHVSDMDKLTAAMERIVRYMVTQRVTHQLLQILYTPSPLVYI